MIVTTKYVNTVSVSIDYVINSCKDYEISINTLLALAWHEIHLTLAYYNYLLSGLNEKTIRDTVCSMSDYS
jgi:hypothetical protein